MKKRILSLALVLATLVLTPQAVHADVTHNPKAYTAIPIKIAKAKGTDTHTMETHWWVFNHGEIHEFVSFEENGTINLGNAYPTVICDCMWDEESETDNTDSYCQFAFIPNLDEGNELYHELNRKGTRVLWFEIDKESFQIDKNLNRISEGN